VPQNTRRSAIDRSFSRSALRRIPIEYRIGLAFTALWLLGVLVGLPVNVPTRDSVRGLELHFFYPVAVAAGLQILAFVVFRFTGRGSRRAADAFVMVRLIPLLLLSLFLYFNFKAWMPLVNPALHDTTYQATDEALSPLLTLSLWIREGIAGVVPYATDHWYALLFFAMFFLTLGVHGLIDSPVRQRQLMLGLCLNLILGGLAYWVAPAVGPFLFYDGANEAVLHPQELMFAEFQGVRATGELPPGYFVMPLAAMPSLHTAHAVYFCLWAWRSAKWLLIPYAPITLWILVEATASNWHYLIDLPIGAALALFSFYVVQRIIPERRASGREIGEFPDAAPTPGVTAEPSPLPELNGSTRPEPARDTGTASRRVSAGE
jgi:hypothetical protein